jgi:hypothetical protein
MMELLVAMKRASRCTLCCVLLSAALAMMTACGGSTPPPQVGLPPPPAPGLVNSYLGQPGDSPSQNSLWNVTIDRSKNAYSYGPSGGTATSGSIAILNNNFVILLDQNGYQSGLAVEAPGGGIILRPGGSSAPLVFAVQQASCFAIGGNVKFLYALSPGLSSSNTAFFGEIYAATGADGSTWEFNNQTNFISPYEFQLENTNVPPAASFPGYPGGYSANCSAASGAATVSAAPLAYFNNGSSSFTVPTQFVISPSGLFFENQNYTNVPASEGWQYANVAAWGVSEPVNPVGVAGASTENLLGFLFESNRSTATFRTRLVGFGNGPSSGTILTGGTFPSEDPTQPVTVNMSVTFNGQDPLNNGLFYLAKLTIPNDAPSDFTVGCLSYGISPAGDSTCTNDGVAMLGQQNGVYTIIMSATDTSGNQKTLVLFQQ